MAKITKVEAKYVARSKRGAEWCARCAMFRPPAACSAVEGEIAPGGWCRLFVKRKSLIEGESK